MGMRRDWDTFLLSWKPPTMVSCSLAWCAVCPLSAATILSRSSAPSLSTWPSRLVPVAAHNMLGSHLGQCNGIEEFSDFLQIWSRYNT